MALDESGSIFDIRRFSLHDGDGIRTTIFLKGCPLSCAWCHNPEGIPPAKRLIHHQSKCIRCGYCLRADQGRGLVRWEDHHPHFASDAGLDWADYIDACPTGAIRMDAADYTVADVMARVRQDAPFYRYGGGVTLSGGEPLSQPAFTKALLTACRAEGINTAIETSLFASASVAEDVLTLCDTIFADFKIFDDALHRAHTGVSNDLIKSNLDALLRSPLRERVIVRTPLIPLLTATAENVTQIAAFIAERYPGVRYELLNYNPLAMSKYALLGQSYVFDENPDRLTDGEMESFRAASRAAGVQRIVTA